MPLLETPRSLARDGGWKPITGASPTVLPLAYRHYGVSLGSLTTFILPFAQYALGRPILPLGHQVFVHNLSPSASARITVPNDGGFFSTHDIPAGKSCGFTLVGYHDETRGGFWIKHRTDFTSVTNLPTYPDGFRAELSIAGHLNNYNMLSECVARGYDGTVGALVIVTMEPGVIVGSTNNISPSFDTGGDTAIGGVNWHASSKLFLRVPADGGIQGCPGTGGRGGAGGTGGAPGFAATDGGIALRAGFSVTIANLGRIAGGCGGGGGGDGQLTTPGLNGGGGGGGAGAEVWRGGVVKGGAGGFAGSGAQLGQPGTVTQGGAYGLGASLGGTIGGRGGNGGNYSGSWAPQAGSPGRQLNDAGNSATGLGGAAGAGVSRKSVAVVTFTPWSTGFLGGGTIVVG